MNTPFLIWIGIFLCLSQSAMFSGLNLGLFSLDMLELKVAARSGDTRAKRVLKLRDNANYALVTILWGNVGVNVLLALLSDSILAGVAAFLFSTVVITIFAEIIPQSYFSRHALDVTSFFLPVLLFYQVLLFPVAKPTALILDKYLGGEKLRYFKEKDLRSVIRLHMESVESDIARVEGQGAINFLELDDVPLEEEGESVAADSIIELVFEGQKPIFPEITPTPEDIFLQKVNSSGKSWVVIVDTEHEPRLVLNADTFIREALFAPKYFNPYRYCHKPIMVKDRKKKLGELIPLFQVRPGDRHEDIVENDIILLWNDNPTIVTGTDILGRLLRGIAKKKE